MRATQQMTKGSPWKLILAFSFPLMLGNLCQQFYIMVDAAIVGQILGVSAIAAVGATEWIIWMMQGLVQGFTQGFSIKMAQDYGAEDYSSLRKDVVHSLVLSIVSTLILVILCFVSMKAMLSMLNTPTDVLGDASIYLKTMIFALPIVMVYNLTAAILRSLGDSKTPLIAMIVASIVNIILDILFVYNFKMGVFGAAFATMIAQCFSAVICLIKCMSISYLRFFEEDRKFDKVLSLYLMKLGMPMAFQNAVISIGEWFYNLLSMVLELFSWQALLLRISSMVYWKWLQLLMVMQWLLMSDRMLEPINLNESRKAIGELYLLL